MAEKRGRLRKSKPRTSKKATPPKKSEIREEIQEEKPVAGLVEEEKRLEDRMMRYGHPIKEARACPTCGAFPVITMIKRGNYQLKRCRECGHRWEIK